MDQKPVGAQVDAPVPSRDARTARLERRCYAKTLRAIQPIRELNSVSSLVSVRIATAMRKSAHFPDSSKCVLHFLEREEWLNGTEEEKRAILRRRKVLELVNSKKDARLLWCKYVDRKKQRNGKTDIYKILLVALWPGEG
jgi:hypothetical protein